VPEGQGRALAREETYMGVGEVTRIEITLLRRMAEAYQHRLAEVKRSAEPSSTFWYPYGTLSNFIHLEELLRGDHRYLLELADGRPIADVGAADGDLAFFLEQELGVCASIIDHAPTNFNSLRGARLLKERLSSSVEIHDIDLDQLQELPQERYGLVFFLGILYHLKNPYFALEAFARRASHLVLSTRVARFTPDKKTALREVPVAYLLHETEANNDPTNFWIFSEAGLLRLFQRTGWEVLDFLTVGDTERSDPASSSADERAFCLLRSRVA
jgi:tRNA (mo5U34)-methyltransferase